jgi:hypothetical protein
MSTELALILVALLLSLWALTWARRASVSAERTALAAGKSALAAERSALAARRGADAAEVGASAARTASGRETRGRGDPTVEARTARIDAVVNELLNCWSRDGSAWPLIERNPALPDDAVEEIIQNTFHVLGRTEIEARQHSVAVLNMRRDTTRLELTV